MQKRRDLPGENKIISHEHKCPECGHTWEIIIDLLELGEEHQAEYDRTGTVKGLPAFRCICGGWGKRVWGFQLMPRGLPAYQGGIADKYKRERKQREHLRRVTRHDTLDDTRERLKRGDFGA